MEVRLTPAAREQLLEALDYLRQDRPTAAGDLLDRVGTALSRLSGFPHSGRPIPEFPDLPYREVVLAPRHLFYRVVGETVWVVAVWHDRQLPRPPSHEGTG
ncbi:MAG: hypothetical protein Kow00129_15960 [Thermoleophilia bacterium]